jgi:hypothetical protein
MRGLSITSIGKRGITECVNIYQTLEPALHLEYLELAVGSRNDLQLIPDVNLALHHRCLFDGTYRLPFSLLDKSSWVEYKQRLEGRRLLFFSVHPPERKECEWEDVVRARCELEEYLQIPIAVEIMPAPHYWGYKDDPLTDVPLCFDISHVNLWAEGNAASAMRWVEILYDHMLEVHLSHNDGKCDSHDMIPEDVWFKDVEWSAPFITYESLPVKWRAYERLDKNNPHETKPNNRRPVERVTRNR